MKKTTKTTIKNPSSLVVALFTRVKKQSADNRKTFFGMFNDWANHQNPVLDKQARINILGGIGVDEKVALDMLSIYREWLQKCNLKPLAYYRKRKASRFAYKANKATTTKDTNDNLVIDSNKKSSTNNKGVIKMATLQTATTTSNVVNIKGAIVEIDVNGVYTLKAGSIVSAFSAYTLNAPQFSKLVSLRNNNSTTNASGNIIITNDIVCSSSSQCASLIYGASKSGNVVFKQQQGKPRQKATTTTTSNVNTTTNQASNVNTTTTTTNPTTTTSQDVDKQDADNDGNKATKKQAKQQVDAIAFKVDTIEKIQNFCKDFEYKPDGRIINTMYYSKDPTEFLINTMELTFGKNFNENLDLIKNTLTKCEWKDLMSDLKKITPTHPQTNERLAIYYGDAGTGKTEMACFEYGVKTKVNQNNPNFVENKNVKKIVANKTQDPADLFTYFNPKTRVFELTEIGIAMQNGYPIIIDEANLYSSACFQRLQGILDNTSSVSERGIDISIKDGFKVIMTLNLETNVDGKRPLPNPIVSRAKEIRNFNSTELIKKSYEFVI